MSSIYITTSRKPTQLTRRLARWLELLLNAKCENRGKHSFDEIQQRAEAMGLKKLLFVYEKHGNPSSLSFWQGEWKEPEIQISGVVFPLKARITVPKEAKVFAEDGFGKKFAALLDLDEPEAEFVQINASAKQISFEFDGKRIGPILKLRSA